MIDSVKIIHDELEGGEYRFLADYFRLVGAYVSECTLKSREQRGDFSAVIIIKTRMSDEDIANYQDKYPNAVLLDTMNLSWKERGKKKYLLDCLNKIVSKISSSAQDTWQREIESLNVIADVYVKYKLLYYRNAFSYFYEHESIVQEAQDQFVEAYISLKKQLENRKEDVHSIYTQVNLARYINETCNILNQSFLFDTGKCLKKADQALELEPSFSNVYLLKAMLAEMDDIYQYESRAYYRIALENLDGMYYASYPYYRCGRYYEKVLKQEKEANEYYTKAVQINELEYRAIYKLILFTKKEGRYQEAIEYCKKICNILKNKKNANYMQPREYEYLFKAYLEMTKIYGNYLSDNNALQEAIRNRNSVCPIMTGKKVCENKIYKQIFGSKEAAKFLELTYERLNTTVLRCEQ